MKEKDVMYVKEQANRRLKAKAKTEESAMKKWPCKQWCDEGMTYEQKQIESSVVAKAPLPELDVTKEHVTREKSYLVSLQCKHLHLFC